VGKGGWCVGLTTLSPSCAERLEIWEPLPPRTVRACIGIALTFIIIIIIIKTTTTEDPRPMGSATASVDK
jgi:hypothetical protein